MDLLKASNQWATRPADERYWTVQEMVEDSIRQFESSAEAEVTYGSLEVFPKGPEVMLRGSTGAEARLTNYSAGQLAQRIGAPHRYLATLTPQLASQCMNYGLTTQRSPADQAKMLVHRNGDLLVRCLTGVGYARIWNYQIGQHLLDLEADGWRVPPARPAGIAGERTRQATEADVLRGKGSNISIRVGDLIAPAGVYASDRDMFVFMVDDEHTLDNPADPSTPLARGFFVWNSEVGDRSFGVQTFYYDHVCGNHIVWGARDVKEIRIRHVGLARQKAFRKLRVELRSYADSSVSDDQAILKHAQTYQIGGTKETVLEELLGFTRKKKLNLLTEKVLSDAYTTAERETRYGDPRTPWGIVQGITHNSQEKSYTSQRVEMDRQAGRLMQMAF